MIHNNIKERYDGGMVYNKTKNAVDKFMNMMMMAMMAMMTMMTSGGTLRSQLLSSLLSLLPLFLLSSALHPLFCSSSSLGWSEVRIRLADAVLPSPDRCSPDFPFECIILQIILYFVSFLPLLDWQSLWYQIDRYKRMMMMAMMMMIAMIMTMTKMAIQSCIKIDNCKCKSIQKVA